MKRAWYSGINSSRNSPSLHCFGAHGSGFDDDAVDPRRAEVRNHTLKIFSLQIGRATRPVVDLLVGDRVGITSKQLVHRFTNNLALIGNGLGLVVPILMAQSDVNGGQPLGRLNSSSVGFRILPEVRLSPHVF